MQDFIKYIISNLDTIIKVVAFICTIINTGINIFKCCSQKRNQGGDL